jgi:DNA-binding response OmpR family regulator
MLVDDDRTTTSLLQTLLELDGFDVVSVARGADVIPTAEKAQPHAILMDYHLTDTNGVEVLKKIRVHATLSHLPVVIASGMNVHDEAMGAGATQFLIKPFEPADLTPLFNKLIG